MNSVIAHPAMVMGTPMKIPSKVEALYLASRYDPATGNKMIGINPRKPTSARLNIM